MATKTSRRRFWVFIFPAVAVIVVGIAVMAFQVITKVPEQLREIRQGEAREKALPPTSGGGVR